MCSYNSVQGIPTCLSPLLREARRIWGFDGYVTSDTDSIHDAYAVHKYVQSGVEASCDAVKLGGCDINSGDTYANHLLDGVKSLACTMSDVDAAIAKTLRVRFQLGLFDPAEQQPLTRLGVDDIGSAESQNVSLDATLQSLVLLENNNNTLPWKTGLKLAVIGPHGNGTDVMGNHYKGFTCPSDSTSCIVTAWQGFARANVGGSTSYAEGSKITESIPGGIDEAKALADSSDAIVLMLGIDAKVATEAHDRTSIDLPQPQHDLAAAVLAAGKPTTIILISGGMLAVEQEMNHVSAAIIQAFYPGRYTGTALAATVFGEHNPGGKLPYTVRLSK